jgi:hypothetical protein
MPPGVTDPEAHTSTGGDLGHSFPDRTPSASLLRADGASDPTLRHPVLISIPG